MTPSSSPKPSRTSLPKKLTFAEGIPVETIVWYDATYDSDDIAFLSDLTDFGKLWICLDTGFVVRENKKEVVLAVNGCANNDSVRQSNTIPKSLIIARISHGVVKWTLPSTTPKKVSQRSTAKTHSSTGSISTSTPTTPNTGQNYTTDAPQPPSQ